MPFGLGFGETILILAVILLFFGPKRLPEAASSLGKGIREFKRAVSGVGEELMSPANTVAAPPAPPPHATLAGTGADPLAVPSSAPEPVASETATAHAGATEEHSPAAPEAAPAA
ncbi:MAG TPA: twin-arginine translocase TatA/TatE family subunit [Longimicrobiaceae bacterium]